MIRRKELGEVGCNSVEPPITGSLNVTDANLFHIRQTWWNRQFLLTWLSDIGRCSHLSHTSFSMNAKESFLAW